MGSCKALRNFSNIAVFAVSAANRRSLNSGSLKPNNISHGDVPRRARSWKHFPCGRSCLAQKILARGSCFLDYPESGLGTKKMPEATLENDAFSTLPTIIADAANRNRNEAETRHKIIDFILHELLAWPRNRVAVEENIHPGFADYILKKRMASLLSSLRQRGKGFISNCPWLTTQTRRHRISASKSFLRTQI